MAAIDDFFPYVQPQLTSCPNPLVRSAIRQAIGEFCERSQAWSLRLPPVALVQGQAAYTPTLPEGAALVEILNLWAASRELQGKSFDEITQLIPNWQTQVGSPLFFLTDNVVDNLEVYPLPDAGAAGTTLLARVALKPTLAAATVPDFLANRFYDAISYGAFARLMTMSNQPWSDPAQGADYGNRFRTACEDARIEQMHGRVAGSLVVKPRAFGRSWP